MKNAASRDEIESLNKALSGFTSLASNPTSYPGTTPPRKGGKAWSDTEIDALFE